MIFYTDEHDPLIPELVPTRPLWLSWVGQLELSIGSVNR
jgi:hypothetical protein